MPRLPTAIAASPALVRVLPFVIFAGLTGAQGQFGEAARYWIYFAKTVAGAGMLWAVRPFIAELRWEFNPAAILVGVGVFGLWVGLDELYPKLLPPDKPWNPPAEFESAWARFFITIRLLGSSLVVPPLEEVFYRSWLYRYLINPGFQSRVSYFWLTYHSCMSMS